MTDADVLRRFNRLWSQRVGLLAESYLGQGRSLGASRLLFEIGAEGAGVLELRSRLGLDSGYLSRLLRSLEDDRLIGVRPDPQDRRRRVVVPTAKGRRAIGRLERLSEEQALAVVAPLGASQRRRLDDALATADRLIRAAGCEIEVVDARSPEALDAVRVYVAELAERFPAGFDPGDVAEEAPQLNGPDGRFLVGRIDGVVAACGGVRRLTRTRGEIKRMWVDGAWRGCGLGATMLGALEETARELGYREVYLDTNGTLAEAIAMYERAGYRRIERYNDNPYAEAFFAKRLTRSARPR